MARTPSLPVLTAGLALAFSLALVACTSSPRVSVNALTELDAYEETDTVDVIPHPDSLTRDYEELALMRARATERVYDPDASDEPYVEALREEAAELGADAIVILERKDPSLVAGNDRRGSWDRIQRAERKARQGDRDRLPRVRTAPWAMRAVAVAYR